MEVLVGLGFIAMSLGIVLVARYFGLSDIDDDKGFPHSRRDKK